MRILLALPLLLAACVEEPTPKEAEKAVKQLGEDEVKGQKKTIEEAAEEATKLVEADAKAEIDATEPPAK
jgi:hypothetical protein